MNLSSIMQEVYRFNFNWLLKLGSQQINSTEFPNASVVIGQRASDLQYMTRL